MMNKSYSFYRICYGCVMKIMKEESPKCKVYFESGQRFIQVTQSDTMLRTATSRKHLCWLSFYPGTNCQFYQV